MHSCSVLWHGLYRYLAPIGTARVAHGSTSMGVTPAGSTSPAPTRAIRIDATDRYFGVGGKVVTHAQSQICAQIETTSNKINE